MQSEQNGKWQVTLFASKTKSCRIDLRRNDELKHLTIPLDLIILKPELFDNRTNLYHWYINDLRLNKIVHEVEKYPLRLSILKYLNSGKIYSRDALYKRACLNKKLDLSYFDEVYQDLIKEKLIDENEVLDTYIRFSLQTKRLGKERIIINLIKRGFAEHDILNALAKFSENEFFVKAAEESERIQRHARKGLSNRASTQMRVQRRLVNRGFSEEIATHFASQVPYEEEHVYLLNDLEKLKRKFKSLKPFPNKYYNRIVNSLIRKGYNYYYIEKVFPKHGEFNDD